MQAADWIRVIGEVLGFLLAGVGVVVAVRVSIAVLNTKVDFMAGELQKITGILERLAGFDEKFRSVDRRFDGQDDRLNRIEGRLDELAHGESFVLPITKGAHER